MKRGMARQGMVGVGKPSQLRRMYNPDYSAGQGSDLGQQLTHDGKPFRGWEFCANENNGYRSILTFSLIRHDKKLHTPTPVTPPPMVRPSMQQIADAAGVSKSSVSLALRNNPRIPTSTRKRIQRIAHELGYRRNPVVDTLMTQLRSSRPSSFQANLGLLNCSATRRLSENHTFCTFREGLRSRADQLGYGVEEFWLEEPGMRPKRLKQILQTRNINGLVLMATLTPHVLHKDYDGFWNDFSCAVIGVTHVETHLPCATNDQYLTAKRATERLLSMGYQRPGLVVEPELDELLDGRFSAGVYAGTGSLPTANRLPPFPLERDNPKPLLAWVKKAKPDVIITNEAFVRQWMEEDGFRIPDDLGIIHLDWHHELGDWAGMQQNNSEVARAGADLVIHQLQKNEIGPRPNPKMVVIESDWVDGGSVRTKTP